MPRPREPLIERERAVSVALEMIDEEGLSSFSIEKLSRRLGVRGPSLYHHFADRADLLSHVAELILHEVPTVWEWHGDADELEWDQRLLRATVELRRAVVRHRNAGPLLLEHFPRALVLRAYESAVALLERSDVPSRFHILIIEGLEKLALGFGLSRPAAENEHGVAFPEVSSDSFPALSRALDAAELDNEAIFEAVCASFLSGVKRRIAEGEVEPPRPLPARRRRTRRAAAAG